MKETSDIYFKMGCFYSHFKWQYRKRDTILYAIIHYGINFSGLWVFCVLLQKKLFFARKRYIFIEKWIQLQKTTKKKAKSIQILPPRELLQILFDTCDASKRFPRSVFVHVSLFSQSVYVYTHLCIYIYGMVYIYLYAMWCGHLFVSINLDVHLHLTKKHT